MIVVLDANILLRFCDPTATHHPVAVAALAELRSRGDSLRTLPQSIYEFWVVATRPVVNNGLGLSIAECDQTVTDLLSAFPCLDDSPTLFAAWRGLVVAHACHGKVAHDARYVAAMRGHGLTHLLTFNGSDFARFTGIVAIDPNTVVTALPGTGPTSSP